MRNHSAPLSPHYHHHHLFIRNCLTDFRRQSSVNDYKLEDTLVCMKVIQPLKV